MRITGIYICCFALTVATSWAAPSRGNHNEHGEYDCLKISDCTAGHETFLWSDGTTRCCMGEDEPKSENGACLCERETHSDVEHVERRDDDDDDDDSNSNRKGDYNRNNYRGNYKNNNNNDDDDDSDESGGNDNNQGQKSQSINSHPPQYNWVQSNGYGNQRYPYGGPQAYQDFRGPRYQDMRGQGYQNSRGQRYNGNRPWGFQNNDDDRDQFYGDGDRFRDNQGRGNGGMRDQDDQDHQDFRGQRNQGDRVHVFQEPIGSDGYQQQYGNGFGQHPYDGGYPFFDFN